MVAQIQNRIPPGTFRPADPLGEETAVPGRRNAAPLGMKGGLGWEDGNGAERGFKTTGMLYVTIIWDV